MRSIKIPNPGVDHPYGPTAGGQNARSTARERLTMGFGGSSKVYGPAAKPDQTGIINKNSIPTGYTCARLSQR